MEGKNQATTKTFTVYLKHTKTNIFCS